MSLQQLNSISVISGRYAGDNEMLCALESRLPLKRSRPQAGLELWFDRSVGQRLNLLSYRGSCFTWDQNRLSCKGLFDINEFALLTPNIEIR